MAAESIIKEVQHSPRGLRPLPRCQSLQSRRSRSWFGCCWPGSYVCGMEASNWVRMNGQRVGGDGERGGWWMVDGKTVGRVGSAVGFALVVRAGLCLRHQDMPLSGCGKKENSNPSTHHI
jgi:hypothetical protein